MNGAVIIPINHIERKPDSHKYRVVGKGVTVEFLSRLIDDPEWPVSRIAENYGLTPAEIHAAWAFYYDHREEIEETLAQAEGEVSPSNKIDAERRSKVQDRYRAKTGKIYPED